MMRTAEEARPEETALSLQIQAATCQWSEGASITEKLQLTSTFRCPFHDEVSAGALCCKAVNSAVDPVQDRGAPASKLHG